MDWMLFLSLTIAVAGFSYEAAHGTLANFLKSLFCLDQRIKYNPIFYYKFWKQLLGSHALWLLPFILVLVTARLTHSWLYSLFSCPYCQSVWYMFAINFWVMELSLLLSLTLAPVAILFVAVIDRLRT